MGNSRFAARCLLVVCGCLPVLAAAGDAFADERTAVNVEARPDPAATGRPAGPVGSRTQVHTGRVHVVYQPGVLTAVRIGDDVSVTVRPGCGCPAGPGTTPPATPSHRPPATEPAVPPTGKPASPAPPAIAATGQAAGPSSGTRPPPAAPMRRPYASAAVDALPEAPGTTAPVAEPPATRRPLRTTTVPPEDEASPPGFTDGITPVLVVSILPAALAALLPNPARRGVRT
ncbi:hypothetical protein OG948_16300 [Embleya sp. NBC_00888]|uniref:hypothetical protein n=1 Tax=Embleya sp. NBC_00888 TaxID=2975960 RepID=UPI003869D713|nr:hypothetical protein OG948_16300 [Embleya sp. NBC_00888]